MNIAFPSGATCIARRKASIKTRIETLFSIPLHGTAEALAERLPLKQGLKHQGHFDSKKACCARRKASIKTRIETRIPLMVASISGTRRKASIKTRIETPHSFNGVCIRHQLAERLPLKQGLKLYGFEHNPNNIKLAERLPLKQGLKLKVALASDFFALPRRKASIKTRIETKKIRDYVRAMPSLAERLPLKQGLKLENR